MAKTVVFNFELGDVVAVRKTDIVGKITELSINTGEVTWAYLTWMDNIKKVTGGWFPELELTLNA